MDFHCHSRYSDGDLTIEQLIAKAEEEHLYVLSITDHDQIDHFEYIKMQKTKIMLLLGTELTCKSSIYPGDFHLLVYFDENSFVTEEFKIFEQKLKQMKYTRYERIKLLCSQMNIGFNFEQFLEFHKTLGSMLFMRCHMAKYLVHKNLAQTVQHAFDQFLQLDVESEYFNLEEEITRCKKMNAVCSLAHPLKLLRKHCANIDALEEAFCQWKQLGLNIVEVEHPTVTNEERQFLNKMCKKFQFQSSVGSDYHNEERELRWGAGLGNSRGWLHLRHCDQS